MTPHTRLIALIVAGVLAAVPATARAGSTCDGQRWLGAWAGPPTDAAEAYDDQTLRLNLTPLRPGTTARVRLSNRFGTQRVTFAHVALGKQRSRADLVAGSNRSVRFGGRRSVTVAPGHDVLSDRVRLSFRAFQHLAVSVHVRGGTGPATRHAQAHQTSFVSAPGAGDLTGRSAGEAFPTSTTARPFVTGLDVRGSDRDGVIAAIGDSITDGDQRSPRFQELGVDADARYPDYLARRLAARRGGRRFSVLNLGIGGNRILRSSPIFAGQSLLRRLEPDLLDRPDVTDVVLTEGLNDLGMTPSASADRVIAGLKRAVKRLRATRRRHRSPRLNVLVGTLTPAGGGLLPGYGTARTDRRRRVINGYVRTGGIGDGVIDFDRAVRDRVDPSRLAPRYDSGDHLHPSSAGYRRMAQVIELARFEGPRC